MIYFVSPFEHTSRYIGCGVIVLFVFLYLMLVALGAAYGTAKSATGIAAMSVMRPDLIMKSVVPVVMAGIIAIYGLVVAVLISQKRKCVVCLLSTCSS